MYKVFINDSCLQILNKPTDSALNYEGLEQLKSVKNELEENNGSKISIYDEKLNEVWDDFKSLYKIIEAAGGLVFNQNEELLMIYRLGKWDLPKGKIEEGEEPNTAALREVEEECGIHNLKLGKGVKRTYHTYNLKGKAILKITYWYYMKYEGEERLIPQTEEDISKVEWVKKTDLPKKLENTYGNIRDLVLP